MRVRETTLEERRILALREFFASQLRRTHRPGEVPCADGEVRYFSETTAYERAFGEAVQRRLDWHLHRERLQQGRGTYIAVI